MTKVPWCRKNFEKFCLAYLYICSLEFLLRLMFSLKDLSDSNTTLYITYRTNNRIAKSPEGTNVSKGQLTAEGEENAQVNQRCAHFSLSPVPCLSYSPLTLVAAAISDHFLSSTLFIIQNALNLFPSEGWKRRLTDISISWNLEKNNPCSELPTKYYTIFAQSWLWNTSNWQFID